MGCFSDTCAKAQPSYSVALGMALALRLAGTSTIKLSEVKMKAFLFIVLTISIISCSGNTATSPDGKKPVLLNEDEINSQVKHLHEIVADTMSSAEILMIEKATSFLSEISLSSHDCTEAKFYEFFGLSWKEAEEYYKRQSQTECYKIPEECPSLILNRVLDVLFLECPTIASLDLIESSSQLFSISEEKSVLFRTLECDTSFEFFFVEEEGRIIISDILINDSYSPLEEFEE